MIKFITSSDKEEVHSCISQPFVNKENYSVTYKLAAMIFDETGSKVILRHIRLKNDLVIDIKNLSHNKALLKSLSDNDQQIVLFQNRIEYLSRSNTLNKVNS